MSCRFYDIYDEDNEVIQFIISGIMTFELWLCRAVCNNNEDQLHSERYRATHIITFFKALESVFYCSFCIFDDSWPRNKNQLTTLVSNKGSKVLDRDGWIWKFVVVEWKHHYSQYKLGNGIFNRSLMILYNLWNLQEFVKKCSKRVWRLHGKLV